MQTLQDMSGSSLHYRRRVPTAHGPAQLQLPLARHGRHRLQEHLEVPGRGVDGEPEEVVRVADRQQSRNRRNSSFQ